MSTLMIAVGKVMDIEQVLDVGSVTYNPRQQTEAILYTCFAAPYQMRNLTLLLLSLYLCCEMLGGICQKSHRFRCSFSTRLLRRFGVVPVCKSCMQS